MPGLGAVVKSTFEHLEEVFPKKVETVITPEGEHTNRMRRSRVRDAL